jgi:2-methylcitrate dehydratase PrpD
VTLSDGQTFEQRVDYQTGSIQNPMTQAQIENKFRDCAAQSVKTDVASKILAVLNGLPARPSFDQGELIRSTHEAQRNAGAEVPDYASAPSGLQTRKCRPCA